MKKPQIVKFETVVKKPPMMKSGNVTQPVSVETRKSNVLMKIVMSTVV